MAKDRDVRSVLLVLEGVNKALLTQLDLLEEQLILVEQSYPHLFPRAVSEMSVAEKLRSTNNLVRLVNEISSYEEQPLG